MPAPVSTVTAGPSASQPATCSRPVTPGAVPMTPPYEAPGMRGASSPGVGGRWFLRAEAVRGDSKPGMPGRWRPGTSEALRAGQRNGGRMDLGLTDRVYVVADAGVGLGRACAEQRADEGARLVLAGRD